MRVPRIRPRRILAFTAGFAFLVFVSGCIALLLALWFSPSLPQPPLGWGGCHEANTYAVALDSTGRPIACVPFESPATP
jgi:hypothetical protein